MEAHKERNEQVEKEENTRGSEKIVDNKINDRCKRELENDTVTKRIIRDNIISNGETAQAPNDVLAFSRSVHKVDSSLE
ncbi:hypothetical protein MtrunA17_Chr2g0298831 [Medicago truncatula]|nr:hypothetical protein MtrDRAFT_AC148819g3v2 [Medicago truncatula]RHN73471.1 hypothetical protein MtrunA17_Chr2g0298831 [Medicago truncatula]